ncbi:TIGR02757 family protein [Leptospira sp. GIMC2001]|uniref:TIGR02757 family protein n=1 Tax=Leptospira sp. GIMC2001 TaxID=1513297 RepID=UPI002349BF66|nr:TIGR02757 family protein [Leptospira sp. GIMC2001]WCL51115.1 TIGR02757 family protein [Leptospira sp. GIMC2001]
MEYLKTDPIELVYNYKNKTDQEIVGLIVALYSYGNVSSIRNFLNKILILLGEHPFRLLQDISFDDLANWKGKIGVYRFQKEKDTLEFLRSLKILINSKSPIFEKYFISDSGIVAGITNFQKTFMNLFRYQSNGLKFLIGIDKSTSAKKRIFMFLRWMTSNEFPDLGIYHRLSAYDLLLPLDTHIQKIGALLGLTERKTPDYKMALEISQGLQKIVGAPAVSYDFALSRIGIAEKCKSKYESEICSICEIRSLCRIFINR